LAKTSFFHLSNSVLLEVSVHPSTFIFFSRSLRGLYSFWALNVGVWVESCKIIFLRVRFLFTCSDNFAAGCINFSSNTALKLIQTGEFIINLPTVHSITDRQTDDIIMPIADHTVKKYSFFYSGLLRTQKPKKQKHV